MKVYERKWDRFAYPEDMQLILKYLNEHGRILVNESIIESLYYDFSDEEYATGWMSVNEQTLKEFERWLIDVEI